MHLIRRCLAPVLGCLLLMTLVPNHVTADGPRPGLPRHEGAGWWLPFIQGGGAEAKKARQWARVPMQVSTVFNRTEPLPLPPDDPRDQHRRFTNWLYLIAEPGAPHTYGLTAPFTVNTVAFGTIPVSATLRLAQRRTADNLPVPVYLVAYDDYYGPANPNLPAGWASGLRMHDTHLDESLGVQVEALHVDGQDLQLRQGCRTRTLASLRLLGRGYVSNTPGINEDALWETDHFALGRGGRLSGTVDVPPFTGCVTTGGEDVSALLTATVSGPGNAVVLHVNSSQCTDEVPPMPGQYDAAELCPEQLPGSVPLLPTGPQESN